jgi:hypothetical protein
MPLETQSQSRAFFAPNKARFSHQTKRVFRTKQSAFFAPKSQSGTSQFSWRNDPAEARSFPFAPLFQSDQPDREPSRRSFKMDPPTNFAPRTPTKPIPKPLCRITASVPNHCLMANPGARPKRPVTEAASHRSGQSPKRPVTEAASHAMADRIRLPRLRRRPTGNDANQICPVTARPFDFQDSGILPTSKSRYAKIPAVLASKKNIP